MNADPDDGSNNHNHSNDSTQMVQMDAVVEGKLVLPPSTSAHRVRQPKKTYPPPPPGKKFIFRKWTTINGKRVYAPPGKCFPILVDA